MYEKWQMTLFNQLLTELFSKISDPQITWFQFSLILKEGCIKYRSLSQQLKFRKYFQDHQFITKEHLRYNLMLSETLITNNKRFQYFYRNSSIIRMKESFQMLEHKPNRCFEWWKEWMTKNYGPDLKWFDVVCMQKDCFRLKTFKFKNNLAILLKDSPHSNCFIKIASFFPKVSLYQSQTQKNEIEFSSFMSTIQVSVKPKYIQSSIKKKEFNKLSESKALTTKQGFSSIENFKSKNQRAKTQTSQTFYLTEWGEETQYKEEKRPYNSVRRRMFKRKSVSKTVSNFYSVPVKESCQMQRKNQRYRSVYI